MLIIFGFTSKFCNVAKLVRVGILLLVTGCSHCCLSLSTTVLWHRKTAPTLIFRDRCKTIRYILL